MSAPTPSPFGHAYFQAQEQAAAEQFDKVQWYVVQGRAKFFERLTLTSGGAVALSLTLLTAFVGKSTIHSAATLLAAWAAFTAALVAGLFRESFHQGYAVNTYMSEYLKQSILKKQDLRLRLKSGRNPVIEDPAKTGTAAKPLSASDLDADIAEQQTNLEGVTKGAADYERRFRQCEKIAQVAFCFGVILLAIFAAVNTLANAHYLIR